MKEKLKTDIEVINFLLNDNRFTDDINITYLEIIVEVKDGINKKLIKDIEAITDGDYYFYERNRKLAIPRLIDAKGENREMSAETDESASSVK